MGWYFTGVPEVGIKCWVTMVVPGKRSFCSSVRDDDRHSIAGHLIERILGCIKLENGTDINNNLWSSPLISLLHALVAQSIAAVNGFNSCKPLVLASGLSRT